MSSLDANQVIKTVFDESTGTLKTNVQAVVSGGTEVIISHVDDSIKIGDGTDFAAIDTDGSIQTRQVAQLVPFKWDYVAATYPAGDTEVYTFKSGGSGGSTVATVTVVYSDSTKTVLSTVTRT